MYACQGGEVLEIIVTNVIMIHGYLPKSQLHLRHQPPPGLPLSDGRTKNVRSQANLAYSDMSQMFTEPESPKLHYIDEHKRTSKLALTNS